MLLFLSETTWQHYICKILGVLQGFFTSLKITFLSQSMSLFIWQFLTSSHFHKVILFFCQVLFKWDSGNQLRKLEMSSTWHPVSNSSVQLELFLAAHLLDFLRNSCDLFLSWMLFHLIILLWLQNLIKLRF